MWTNKNNVWAKENSMWFIVKAIFVIIYIYLCLVFFIRYDTWHLNFLLSRTTPTAIHTWNNTTIWWEIETWLDIDLPNIIDLSGNVTTWEIVELTDSDLYNQYKSNNNYRSYFPESQNRIVWNYGTNTEYMKKYLSNHTFRFSLPQWVWIWYLYIRIKKPTNNAIFAYWHNSKDSKGYTISWDLDKDSSLIPLSQTEFLYKLNSIPYTRYYDKVKSVYNWQNQLKIENNYIAMFVKDFDWQNQIEEITIAWE